jgi:hypothetical protein
VSGEFKVVFESNKRRRHINVCISHTMSLEKYHTYDLYVLTNMLCAIEDDPMKPKGHDIPRRLKELQELVIRRPTFEEVREWLREIERQTEELYHLVSYFHKGDPLDTVSLALLTQSQFVLLRLNSMDLYELTMKIYGVPQFLEILIEFFGACVKPSRLRTARWTRELQKYRDNLDSVCLMEVIARKINQFSTFTPRDCNFHLYKLDVVQT